MARSTSWVWTMAVVAACALPLLSACGGDDDGGGDDESSGGGNAPGTECQPSNTFKCVGARGCQGIQICNTNGTWGSCSCGGSAGQSGGSGSGAATGGRGVVDPGDGGMVGPGEVDGGLAGAGGAGEAGSGAGAGGAGGDGEAGAGGSASSGDEDCDNNEDDDGDGDVDCADDDCDSRVCARNAPTDWDGPVVLYLDDLPDECPKAFDDELARGGLSASGDDAECDTCSCSASSADCATFLNFSFGYADDCSGVVCPSSVSASCISVPPGCLSGSATAYFEPKLPSGLDSCEPSGQTPSISDAEWQDEALACGTGSLERGGCASGSVCAPPLPDGAALCIMRSGDRECPGSGPYTERTVFYTEIEDTRACSDCECAQDCDYTWYTFASADTTCETPLVTLSSVDEECAAVTPSGGAVRVGVDIAGNGDCAASGGEPEGSVSEAGAFTVCCRAE